MARFLTESYLSAGRMTSLIDDADRLDAATVTSGARRLATMYVPTDETCLHLFDADTAEQVTRSCAKAGVLIDRVNPAIYLGGVYPTDLVDRHLAVAPDSGSGSTLT